ncbi:hypothetical protein Amal_03642 [Acetobacter malorum]|uniref:Uncharacterized protein n=1 Tax=Acetobacter malorum TaxID=178901 RepID=A0A177G4B5_9PROT|nr:hypothetical protein Amal_03642 [Acetobacter malorum]
MVGPATSVDLFSFGHKAFVGFRRADIVLHLLLEGLSEEGLGCISHALNEISGHMVSCNIQKTHIAGRVSKLLSNSHTVL